MRTNIKNPTIRKIYEEIHTWKSSLPDAYFSNKTEIDNALHEFDSRINIRPHIFLSYSSCIFNNHSTCVKRNYIWWFKSNEQKPYIANLLDKIKTSVNFTAISPALVYVEWTTLVGGLDFLKCGK